MEEEINEEIIKRANEIWEKELKESFSNIMNQKQEEILNGLEKKIDDLIKNKKLNEKNNINNNNYYEDDDKILRKKEIDFQNLKELNFVYLSFLQNSNPLINIVLQCLSNIEYLAMYYLNPEKEGKILKKSKDNPNNTYLGPSFLTLLDHLWKSQHKEYAPLEIHKVLKKLMKNNYNTNDASIIINFILNELDVELSLNQNDNIEQDDPHEHYDEGKIREKFINKFNQNHNQISDTFFSSIETNKKCLNSNHKDVKNEYYFETTPSINIYLTESNEIICDNPETQKLSLEEYFKKLLIEKDKEYVENCVTCESSQKKSIIKEVFTISTVLIIVINRDQDPNNTRYFKYPEKIDSDKIININKEVVINGKKIQFQLEIMNYELGAVIKKNKNKDNNFEFTAFYKNFIDNKWYLYNNQKIMLIQSDYEYYVFDEKNAYVLIYYKKNEQK